MRIKKMPNLSALSRLPGLFTQIYSRSNLARLVTYHKGFTFTSDRRMYSHQTSNFYEDVKIPVPWGVIGARLWGDSSLSPVLCIHGWKDNLATFDRLIPPLLSKLKHKYFFLAIDLPGHGFSSHFPPGMIYQLPDCLILIARIIRHYKWTEPIHYMGHSLGSIMGFIFAATNPGVIDRFIAIDALTPMFFKKDEILNLVPQLIHDTLQFEHKLEMKKPPVYTYEEIVERMVYRTVGGLDEISCKVLLSRGICEAESGSGLFHFTHDIRVQYLPIMMFDTNQISILIKNFQSQILHIRAKQGVPYEQEFIRRNSEDWIRSNTEAKGNRDIVFIEIDGLHHLHLSAPERVAPHIIKFLQ